MTPIPEPRVFERRSSNTSALQYFEVLTHKLFIVAPPVNHVQ